MGRTYLSLHDEDATLGLSGRRGVLVCFVWLRVLHGQNPVAWSRRSDAGGFFFIRDLITISEWASLKCKRYSNTYCCCSWCIDHICSSKFSLICTLSYINSLTLCKATIPLPIIHEPGRKARGCDVDQIHSFFVTQQYFC